MNWLFSFPEIDQAGNCKLSPSWTFRIRRMRWGQISVYYYRLQFPNINSFIFFTQIPLTISSTHHQLAFFRFPTSPLENLIHFQLYLFYTSPQNVRQTCLCTLAVVGIDNRRPGHLHGSTRRPQWSWCWSCLLVWQVASFPICQPNAERPWALCPSWGRASPAVEGYSWRRRSRPWQPRRLRHVLFEPLWCCKCHPRGKEKNLCRVNFCKLANVIAPVPVQWWSFKRLRQRLNLSFFSHPGCLSLISVKPSNQPRWNHLEIFISPTGHDQILPWYSGCKYLQLGWVYVVCMFPGLFWNVSGLVNLFCSLFLFLRLGSVFFSVLFLPLFRLHVFYSRVVFGFLRYGFGIWKA